MVKVKVKIKPTLTDREGPQDCEASRLPHFPDSQLTDDGEGFSVTHRPAALCPQKVSDTQLC
jgi:hypothetical protein